MVHPAGPEFLAERYELIELDRDDRLGKLMPGADAVFVRQDVRIGADLIATAPRLQLIATSGAGLDHLDLAAASAAGVLVTRAAGVGARSVAEHTVGVMIALAKRLPYIERQTRAGNFDLRMESYQEITGKTLAIVGWGAIGRDVARICRDAFQMRILAVTKPGAAPIPTTEATQLNLEEALGEADIVSAHLPLTPQTRKMFGARQFAAMRPTAWFINTARGGIVDEDALVEALRRGTIAGAAIDVYETEPPQADNPLFETETAIVTPHYAGFTDQARLRLTMSSAEDIDAALNGRKPRGLVNPEIWERSRAGKRFRSTAS